MKLKQAEIFLQINTWCRQTASSAALNWKLKSNFQYHLENRLENSKPKAKNKYSSQLNF